MTIDASVVAVFGPAPDSADLTASRVSQNNAAVISMLVLGLVAICLRFLARKVQRSTPYADDYGIIISWLFVAGTVSLSIAGGVHGAGKHVWSLSLDNVTAIYKILYVYTFIYASACSAIKISILIFYKRIFSRAGRSFHFAILFGYFLSISYPIIVWVTMGNCCRPITFYWNQFKHPKTGTCIDVKTFFLALAIINMLTDICILIIPIPEIMQLQMSKKKKAAVAGIMMLGSFVCISSVFRIWYLSQFMNALDVTWLMGPVFIWSAIEPSMGIVSACLPHMGPLRRVAKNKLSGYHNSSSNDHTGHTSNATPWRSNTTPKTQDAFTYSGSRFNFGGSGSKKVVEDEDEMGLTNRVTAGSVIGSTTPKSGSNENIRAGGIIVQSTFVRETTDH